MTAKHIALASGPAGWPTLDNFRFEDKALPEIGAGEVALRTIWPTLDPYMRGRMNEAKSYADPVPIGGTMEGGAISEVTASNNDRFTVGDIVVARIGWASHAVSDGSDIRKADSQGIDLYFENVGSKTTEAAIANMSMFGRIAICGMIAWYNGDNVADAQPLPAVWSSILVKRLRVQGFLFPDHEAVAGKFFKEVAPMVASGQVKFRETVTEGFENAPQAFLELLEGKNFGKQLVRVGDGP